MSKHTITGEYIDHISESWNAPGGGREAVEKAVADDFQKGIEEMEDVVNHPKHYTSHPSGVECIQVTEHMNFNIGNAVKYLWRTDHKNGVEDLKKSIWYINREIERLERTKDENQIEMNLTQQPKENTNG